MNEERIKAVTMLMSMLTDDEKEVVIRNTYQDMDEEFIFAHSKKDSTKVHMIGLASDFFTGSIVCKVLAENHDVREFVKCVLK